MLPKVVIFNAVSLDGRIDNFAADIGLFYGLVGRWKEDATLVGSGTALNAPGDIPEETDADIAEAAAAAKSDDGTILVISDSRGQLKTWHHWRKLPYWKRYVSLCSKTTPREHLEYLRKRNIDCIIAGDDRIDYKTALEELNARYGVQTVRVDSGGTLNGILLRAGLVDELSLLIHPALVGDISRKTFFRDHGLTPDDKPLQLELIHSETLNNNIIWLIYKVKL